MVDFPGYYRLYNHCLLVDEWIIDHYSSQMEKHSPIQGLQKEELLAQGYLPDQLNSVNLLLASGWDQAYQGYRSIRVQSEDLRFDNIDLHNLPLHLIRQSYHMLSIVQPGNSPRLQVHLLYNLQN